MTDVVDKNLLDVAKLVKSYTTLTPTLSPTLTPTLTSTLTSTPTLISQYQWLFSQKWKFFFIALLKCFKIDLNKYETISTLALPKIYFPTIREMYRFKSFLPLLRHLAERILSEQLKGNFFWHWLVFISSYLGSIIHLSCRVSIFTS